MSTGAISATTANTRQLVQMTQNTAGPPYSGSGSARAFNRSMMEELAKG